MVKKPSANAGDLGWLPGSGRSPGGENGNPVQYSCWEIPWTEEPGKEVDITESVCTHTHTHTHTHLICVLNNLKQGLANLIYKSQEVSVLRFTDHMLSVATIQLKQYVDR